MNAELEPRPASRAGTTPEAHNDTAELELPEPNTNNGNNQIGIMSSNDPRSAAQSAQQSSNERCVPGSQGQVAECDTEPQNHTDQDEDVHLIEGDDTIILSEIKDLLMFMSKDDCTEAGGTKIRGLVPRLVDDPWAAVASEAVEHLWWSSGEFSWPPGRDVEGVRQYLIESNDVSIETKAHWSTRWLSPFMDQDIPYHIIENEWREWCCEARNKLQKVGPTHSYCYM